MRLVGNSWRVSEVRSARYNWKWWRTSCHSRAYTRRIQRACVNSYKLEQLLSLSGVRMHFKLYQLRTDWHYLHKHDVTLVCTDELVVHIRIMIHTHNLFHEFYLFIIYIWNNEIRVSGACSVQLGLNREGFIKLSITHYRQNKWLHFTEQKPIIAEKPKQRWDNPVFNIRLGDFWQF